VSNETPIISEKKARQVTLRKSYIKRLFWLAWSYDSERYAGGSVAAGRVSHAGQVKGDDPDKKEYPDPSGWGWAWG
jgi:hypothetical protein